MKRVGNSKMANEVRIHHIQKNLENKFQRAVFVELEAYAGYENRVRFRISFVPGFNHNKCSDKSVFSWKECLQLYQRLMKGDTYLLDNT